jgi:cyanate permease
LGPVMFGYIVDHLGGFEVAWLATGAVVAVGTLMIIFMFTERAGRDD